MIDMWVAEKPNGDVEAITFNPVETPSERAKYAELGWKWTRVIPYSEFMGVQG